MHLRLTLLLMSVCLAPAFAAGVYKWVDEQGQVHFGERPPARAQAQELQLKVLPAAPAATPTEAERRDNEQRLLRAFEEERELKKAQEEQSRKEQAQRERNCILARDRLRRYRSAGSLYNLDQQGNRVTLGENERAAAEQRAEQDVARWCD
ncbi:DUF4124 domain-containing protein [Sulfurivermis fontis]|uniref:DUF4124 domain-containing protein n=1 Tax=Sulfurivermis fontis TaxID=1972068 RepID=UPI000FDBEDB7|nr:DUF4124 domain-containing protein [Sulfurivermis fontis]